MVHCGGNNLEGTLSDNIVKSPKKGKKSDEAAEAEERERLEAIGAAMEKAFDGAEDIYETGQMVSLGIVTLYADPDGNLITKSWMIPGFAPGDFCLSLWNAHYSLAKELLFNEGDEETKH